MTPHHVDSKQHRLSEADIMLVTAHDMKHLAKALWDKANPEIKKAMSPERVLYNYSMIQWNHPGVIRLREGNTLMLLLPKTADSATMLLLNADMLWNLTSNLDKLGEAAKKMGYKTLSSPRSPSEHGHDAFIDTIKQLEKTRDIKISVKAGSIEVEL